MSSWFHSSSSSSIHHHHRHVVHASSYFDDDDGDVKPAVTQHWRYDGHSAASYGGDDVKPPPRVGRGVHDAEETVLSWPVVEPFRSTLRTQESLAGIRARYSVPEGFGLHPAGANQAACSPPPVTPRGGRGGAAAAAVVPICVYAQAFAAGMRLPLHPFVSDALAHFGIAPSQLAPNGWRVLAGFAVLCHFRGVGAPSLPVFRHFFTLAPLPKGKGWYSFRARESVPALFTGLPSSVKAWKEEFLFASPPPAAPWRCPVRWGTPSKEATSDPALTEREAAVARRLTQGQGVVDLKTYLSESNLVAAKISSAPACLGTDDQLQQQKRTSDGTETSRGSSVAAGKKRKVPGDGVNSSGGGVLRSELQEKDKALAKAQGEISRLKAQLGNAKARELEEARQALEYERKLGTQVLKSDGASGSKRRRGGQ
uniref:Transposase (putative) gypsy type domain-containing protein n=1 Tax=Oryza punctata TaxID=4537 RepID=A0A0E0JYX3_ORYPU